MLFSYRLILQTNSDGIIFRDGTRTSSSDNSDKKFVIVALSDDQKLAYVLCYHTLDSFYSGPSWYEVEKEPAFKDSVENFIKKRDRLLKKSQWKLFQINSKPNVPTNLEHLLTTKGWGSCICDPPNDTGENGQCSKCKSASNLTDGRTAFEVENLSMLDDNEFVACYFERGADKSGPVQPLTVKMLRNVAKQREFVNAAAIDAYIALLSRDFRRIKNNAPGLPKTVFVPSYWWHNWRSWRANALLIGSGLLAKLIVSSGCTFDDMERMIFVVNDDNGHYIVITADVKLGTLASQRLFAYDSIEGFKWPLVESSFVPILTASLRGAKMWLKSDRKDITFGPDAALEFQKTPQQDSGSNDCGLAALLCVKHLMIDRDLNYTAADMTAARKTIFHELLAHRLNK